MSGLTPVERDAGKSFAQQPSITKELVGVNKHELISLASGNGVPTLKNCRGFRFDTDSGAAGYATIKFDYIPDGETVALQRTAIVNVREFFAWRNITLFYKEYTAGTSTTAQVIADNGASTVLGVIVVY